MSLKQKILYYLEKNGRMSLLEAENLCKSEGYKLSNLERRCRELMADNPCVRPEKNSAGAIISYTWEDSGAYAVRKAIIEPIVKRMTPPQTQAARAFLSQWKPVEKKEVKELNNTLW